MKKSVIASLLGLAVVSGSAFAADGTITFDGTITGGTCTVTGNTTGGNVSVPLGSPNLTSLNGAVGKTSSPAGFAVNLTNCGTSANGALVWFEPGPTVNPVSGNLLNTAVTTPASGVEIQLTNATASSVINAFTNSGNTTFTTITGGKAQLSYAARIISTSATVTTGKVASTVGYTISYN